jgi:hypothetical protein
VSVSFASDVRRAPLMRKPQLVWSGEEMWTGHQEAANNKQLDNEVDKQRTRNKKQERRNYNNKQTTRNITTESLISNAAKGPTSGCAIIVAELFGDPDNGEAPSLKLKCEN